MKKSTIVFGLIVLAVFTGVISCKKNNPLKDPAITPSGSNAYISLIDVSANLDNILGAKADTFNILFNGVKATGYTAGTSPVMTFSSIYPLAGNNNGYASIPAGSQSIEFANGVNQLDSTVYLSFQKTLLPNTYYSLIITDSIKSTRDSSKMFIKDSMPIVISGYFNLRFVNAALNDTAGVDIWSARNNRTIFANIKPGVIINFTPLAANYPLTDTLFARRAGTTVGLDTLFTQTFSNMRNYTLVYKGNALSNSKTDTKRRHLIAYVNQ